MSEKEVTVCTCTKMLEHLQQVPENQFQGQEREEILKKNCALLQQGVGVGHGEAAGGRRWLEGGGAEPGGT